MENKEYEKLIANLSYDLRSQKLYRLTILAEVLKSADCHRLGIDRKIELFRSACLCEPCDCILANVINVLYAIFLSPVYLRFEALEDSQKIECVKSLIQTSKDVGFENLGNRLLNQYLLKA